MNDTQSIDDERLGELLRAGWADWSYARRLRFLANVARGLCEAFCLWVLIGFCDWDHFTVIRVLRGFLRRRDFSKAS